LRDRISSPLARICSRSESRSTADGGDDDDEAEVEVVDADARRTNLSSLAGDERMEQPPRCCLALAQGRSAFDGRARPLRRAAPPCPPRRGSCSCCKARAVVAAGDRSAAVASIQRQNWPTSDQRELFGPTKKRRKRDDEADEPAATAAGAGAAADRPPPPVLRRVVIMGGMGGLQFSPRLL
jgi:hypothetical protein